MASVVVSVSRPSDRDNPAISSPVTLTDPGIVPVSVVVLRVVLSAIFNCSTAVISQSTHTGRSVLSVLAQLFLRHL